MPVASLIATSTHACEARGHAVLPVSGADIDTIWTDIAMLTRQWATLATDESLILSF
ncbi:MAG: hypothetical protein PSY12_11205 [bacterium]|nr:hypothetical protein [bacterium]